MNKSVLHKERLKLKLYHRLLPSLELKRMQLVAEQAKEEKIRSGFHHEAEQLLDLIREQLPMLANRDIDVDGLVTVRQVTLKNENLLGVILPVLDEVSFKVFAYSMLAKPQWVDRVVKEMKHMIHLQLQISIMAKRIMLLAKAVKRLTQRVNLFKKILIPRTQKNIERIKIFLGDAERAAVIRAKLAKQMHAKAREAY